MEGTLANIRPVRASLLGLLFALSACAGMSEGPIPVSRGIAPNEEPDLSRIRQAMQNDCLNVPTGTPELAGSSVRLTPEELRIRRNNLVTAYMTAADIRYDAFERDLLAFSRQNDLGAALANQLISAIGAASGSASLSQAANLTSGAIGGTQSAFSKSLLNQTVSVLQTHMRAQRREYYAVATRHLAMSYADWNTCQAMQDALAYEQSGTLNAALAAMAASATDQEREGNRQAQNAVTRIAYSGAGLPAALRIYSAGGASQNTRAVAALTELINSRVIVRPSSTQARVRGYLGQLMTGGTPEELLPLIRKLAELEGESAAGRALRAALPPE
jgi:hypothetical protein